MVLSVDNHPPSSKASWAPPELGLWKLICVSAHALQLWCGLNSVPLALPAPWKPGGMRPLSGGDFISASVRVSQRNEGCLLTGLMSGIVEFLRPQGRKA